MRIGLDIAAIVLGVGLAAVGLLALRRRRSVGPDLESTADIAAAYGGSDDSTAALEEALERERFVARISMRVRSELDVDELLRVAVEETGNALGARRCFIRLGDAEDAIPIAAQWHAEGLSPIETGKRLAGSNLAVRRRETVAIEDVEQASELSDPSLGGRQGLLELGSGAVLAVPIMVFEELIGVLALHRSEPHRWSPGEIALTETVAREIGLAIHVARLLRDNERRIAQQAAFFRIAAMLGQSLSLSATLDALGRKTEAADVYRKGIEVATRCGDQHARRELEAALGGPS